MLNLQNKNIIHKYIKITINITRQSDKTFSGAIGSSLGEWVAKWIGHRIGQWGCGRRHRRQRCVSTFRGRGTPPQSPGAAIEWDNSETMMFVECRIFQQTREVVWVWSNWIGTIANALNDLNPNFEVRSSSSSTVGKFALHSSSCVLFELSMLQLCSLGSCWLLWCRTPGADLERIRNVSFGQNILVLRQTWLQ